GGTGTITRVARAGDFEVTIKHPPIEPDKEIAARVFVTRFETNEPVEKAKITLLFTSGGAPVEATAEAANTPGMYEVKLPPMPQGDYKLAARVEGGGGTQTVEYGAIKVAPAPPAQAENSSSWARTALIALASLVGLGIAGFLLYRVAQYARRNRSEGETATA
ncbi:MAG: FixH family protein, partial [Pyrinomonadaceae bacterium]|nr:FixH family protein [Pyrinomonadaceae bacterium]